ncbi:MAG: hypothetical protein QGH15_18375 [Kiritimatiellia bacterium]|nr:hypothetical protein [Kiritimatiellia bacterium]
MAPVPLFNKRDHLAFRFLTSPFILKLAEAAQNILHESAFSSVRNGFCCADDRDPATGQGYLQVAMVI